MATIGGIDPAFTGQSSGGEPPYVRPADPATIFFQRARRFASLATDHEIGAYLTFLSHVATAQGEVVGTAAPVTLAPTVYDVIAHGMPPLSRDLAADPGALTILDALLAQLAAAPLDAGPAAIVAALVAAEPAERIRMLVAVGDGLFEIERLGESALAAAALQVWYAQHAALLDASRLRNIGETICPCCGGQPVSSTVVIWPDAQGNRYLTCAVCCAMWNHVRVKCTACGATKGISYRHIEGSSGDIGAEVCESCQGYAKHLNQTKNAALDPIVDDVASYGLDMLLREEGWRRTGLNPFLILT